MKGVMRESAPGPDEPIRLLLIEDDARTALLIGELLRSNWDRGLVLAHTQRLIDGTREVLDRGADCVLLDLAAEPSDPVRAVEQLRAAAPDVAIVALGDDSDESQALRTIKA